MIPETAAAKAIVDNAAQASDRWLFVALLVVIGFCAVTVWRWFVADRKELANRLDSVTDRHIEALQMLATVVTENKTTMQEVVTTLKHCKGWQAANHLRPHNEKIMP